MKAVIQSAYGDRTVLSVGPIATPRVGSRDLLVRVVSAPVNQGSLMTRSGEFPGITWLPARMAFGLLRPRNPIPGTVFAGVVFAVGADVNEFAVGDRVFGVGMGGAHAEYVRIGADQTVAHIPDSVSFQEAAAAPYGGSTAAYFLETLAQLQPGERVAIVGAGGGVGRFATARLPRRADDVAEGVAWSLASPPSPDFRMRR